MADAGQVFDLPMLVLGTVQDDIEELSGIMELIRPWRKYRPGPITEDAVIEALRSLLKQGLIESYADLPGESFLVAVDHPDLEDIALRGYWYRPTAAGAQLWKEWRTSIDVDESFWAPE